MLGRAGQCGMPSRGLRGGKRCGNGHQDRNTNRLYVPFMFSLSRLGKGTDARLGGSIHTPKHTKRDPT
jgi:hypothetical protein